MKVITQIHYHLNFSIKKFDNLKINPNKKFMLLGDMLELGKFSKKLHIEAAKDINKAKFKKLFVYGNNIIETFNKIRTQKRGKILKSTSDILNIIKNDLNNGDFLMIKGSNSTGLNQITKTYWIKILMLFELFSILVDQFSFLNVFKYLTVRTGLSMFTAMVVVFLVGNPLINFFSSKQIHNPIREDGPSDHIIRKIGTPTMGGLIILLGVFSGVLLWGDLSNPYNWFLIYIAASFGLLGAYDDYKKIKLKSSQGISSKFKFFLQIILALIGIFILYSTSNSDQINNLYFPFFKNLVINLGWFFIPFYMFVLVGASNAVNLTDGLDGLATVPVMLVAACFAFISYVSGNIIFSDYLQITYIEGVGEASIFCGSIIGACLGFLWFNAPPAKIFMGDTGSLSLGGSLGAVGIITKHEIVLAITGGLFVLEAVSVIVQVISYKLTGKRIFRMAPIHHHFEKKGWPESTVVIRFWIISIILAMIGLATLKLR